MIVKNDYLCEFGIEQSAIKFTIIISTIIYKKCFYIFQFDFIENNLITTFEGQTRV